MMHKSQFQKIDPYDWFCAYIKSNLFWCHQTSGKTIKVCSNLRWLHPGSGLFLRGCRAPLHLGTGCSWTSPATESRRRSWRADTRPSPPHRASCTATPEPRPPVNTPAHRASRGSAACPGDSAYRAVASRRRTVAALLSRWSDPAGSVSASPRNRYRSTDPSCSEPAYTPSARRPTPQTLGLLPDLHHHHQQQQHLHQLWTHWEPTTRSHTQNED